MAKGNNENPASGKKPKSVFNPDAPEFSPSQNRAPRKLNADAPEFIPGQFGGYDGGIGYLSVPEMKHGKGHYKEGFARPVPQMYPAEGQYVPTWVPQHQQFVPMWVPFQNSVYAKNGIYEYIHYGYAPGRNFEGPEMHARVPRGGNKRNGPDPEGVKREHGMPYPGRGPASPMHVQNAEISFPAQEPMNSGAKPHNESIPCEDVTRNQNVQIPSEGAPVYAQMDPRPMTWADRFRLSSSGLVNEQPSVPIPMPPVNMWNGRPSFADMMRRSANNVRNEPVDKVPVEEVESPEYKEEAVEVSFEEESVEVSFEEESSILEDSPIETEALLTTAELTTTPEIVSEETEEITEEEESVRSAIEEAIIEKPEEAEVIEEEEEAVEETLVEEKTHEEDTVDDKEMKEEVSNEEPDMAESPSVEETKEEETPEKEEKVEEVEAAEEPTVKQPAEETMVYSMDAMIAYGIYMRRKNLVEDPKLIFSHAAFKDTKGGVNRGNSGIHYEERNNMRQRGGGGDHWTMQRRQTKSDGKGFNNSFRSSNIEFSRDQLEATSLPRASESSWIVKQAKLKMDKEHQLMRRLMGLLNRLTVEKFDTIYKQVLASGVETHEQAVMLVKIIFEKAITQHHFIPMYVELCAKLSYDLSSFTQNDKGKKDQQGESGTPTKTAEPVKGRRSDFMRILLNCCQDSFESNLKPLECPPELEGDDKFEFELKYKHRMKGNMIFVGELFKQKLLAARLLIICLDQVFAKREECIESTGSIDTGDNHLEGMCTLLQAVGKSFDTEKWKYSGELEQRIQRLTELGKNPNICFRIRCLIQNLLDSRHENWVKSAPYKTEGPCRLQELRSKVMEQEKQQEESAWRNRKKNKPFEHRQHNHSNPPPNILATPSTPALSSEDLKRQTRAIVSELALSHDPKEASLRVKELNLPYNRDKEFFSYVFCCAVEVCAKVTADLERSLIAKWLAELATSRSSQRSLVNWLQQFLKDEPVEHGYSMMLEDYPVLPSMLKELLSHMKDGFDNVPGFFEVASFIESEVSSPVLAS